MTCGTSSSTLRALVSSGMESRFCFGRASWARYSSRSTASHERSETLWL
ncbi:MAG: hypothetical protein BWY99_02260 [Synergistetes bacterium ADurb.BinA166]|nr:MAG: hypothetical protein BWY99_02260 [Synergistetes bacterium ADurb.BinA166]